MNTFFYQTKTKYTNTGDALINEALISLLRTKGKLLCNCSNEIPKEFIEQMGIKDDERINSNTIFGFGFTILKKAIFRKKGDKIFIVSGLGHTYSSEHDFKRIIKNYLSCFALILYKILGVKSIRIGISLGPVSNALGLSEKCRSKFVDYYYVRDKKSLMLCKKLKMKRVKYCPDLSWCYLSDRHIKNDINNKKNISINLRTSIFSEKDEKYINNIIDTLSDILKVINDDYQYNFIFNYQVSEDKEFMYSLFKKFENIYNCTFIDKQITLQNANEIYEKCVFNISNRMHSLLLSYKYGCLPIAMIDSNKHFKVAKAFEESNLSKLIYDINDSKIDNLVFILNNKQELYTEILDAEKRQKNIINDILDNTLNSKTKK